MPSKPLSPIRPVLLAAVLAVAGCGSDQTPDIAPMATVDEVFPSTTTPTSTPAPVPGEGTQAFSCEVGTGTSQGDVERIDLTEASGLAASRQHDGVLWSHNDSGQAAGLFALDLTGADLGFFALTVDGEAVSGVDIEDMAIVDRTIYLADIGDNGASRASVTIYLVDEPVPGTDGTAEVSDIIELRYPDGPTDAEAVIVDPADGVVVILSKDLDDPTAPTRIYTVDLPEPGASGDVSPAVVEATLAGSIDMAGIGARSSSISIGGFLYPGSVTGADLSPGADLIVVRTYGSAWLFPRPAGTSVAEALGGEPCEGGAAGETQGEAIAFLPGSTDGTDTSVRYATVGEGIEPAVNIMTVDVMAVGASG